MPGNVIARYCVFVLTADNDTVTVRDYRAGMRSGRGAAS